MIRPAPILLIGAQKSGSSYLFNLMEQDPSVARARLKGPKILSKPMYAESNFYLHFNVGPDHCYVLDGSDSYLHVPGTAERAASKFGPDTPIIAVLREPIDRAVSGYLHEVKHGRELRMPEEVFNLPDDLEEAVAAEGAALEAAWRNAKIQPQLAPTERYFDQFFGFRYVKNSRYLSELEPWFSNFANVRLVDFSVLRTDPDGVLERTRAWLGLSGAYTFKTDLPRNPTKLRYWRALYENRLLRYDHVRPNLLAVWRRQRAIFSKIKDEKPTIRGGLADALRSEFDSLKQTHSSKLL